VFGTPDTGRVASMRNTLLVLPNSALFQNIRNALDYLVYELSPPEVRKQGKTAFPIHDTERGFETDGRQRIREVTGDALALIERFQPYKRTKPPSNDLLSVLRRLSNRDKHRLLLPVAAAVSESESRVASGNAEIQFTYYKPGPVKHDGTILAKWGSSAATYRPTKDERLGRG
jgi:hypothetical protein